MWLKSVHLEPSCYLPTDGRMDDQRHDEDNTRDYANNAGEQIEGSKLFLYVLNPTQILLGNRGTLTFWRRNYFFKF